MRWVAEGKDRIDEETGRGKQPRKAQTKNWKKNCKTERRKERAGKELTKDIIEREQSKAN